MKTVALRAPVTESTDGIEFRTAAVTLISSLLVFSNNLLKLNGNYLNRMRCLNGSTLISANLWDINTFKLIMWAQRDLRVHSFAKLVTAPVSTCLLFPIYHLLRYRWVTNYGNTWMRAIVRGCCSSVMLQGSLVNLRGRDPYSSIKRCSEQSPLFHKHFHPDEQKLSGQKHRMWEVKVSSEYLGLDKKFLTGEITVGSHQASTQIPKPDFRHF